jgi:acyl-CoA thioester hydrolase
MPDGERPPGLGGGVDGGVHRLPLRIYYEDTDFSGAVYHASYLRFLERGRTEFLRGAGIDQSALHAGGEALHFAVRRLLIDYHRPARMDDVVVVETRAGAIRGASLHLAQRILREDEPIATAEVLVAAIVRGKPARLPDRLRSALSGALPAS